LYPPLTPRPIGKVRIITTDGCVFNGILRFADNLSNLTVEDVIELRIPAPDADDDEATEEIKRGARLFRGESIAVVGLLDEELDKLVDWEDIRGERIGTTKRS
jgi:U6 snRNA-associated Sm-like protein LSm8